MTPAFFTHGDRLDYFLGQHAFIVVFENDHIGLFLLNERPDLVQQSIGINQVLRNFRSSRIICWLRLMIRVCWW